MTRRGAPALLAACGLALLAACKVTEPPGDEPPAPPAAGEEPPRPEEPPSLPGDRPAVIVNPTPASHAELERVVSDMLFGAEVTLSKDALTESSVLVVERSRIRRLDMPPLTGRDLGGPERFRLFATASGCVLVHESNHARYELPETDCAPEP